MANCYICSGFIHRPDMKTAQDRTYHNQCWNRLHRDLKLKLESELKTPPRIFPLINVKEEK